MIQKFFKDALVYTLPLLLSRGIGFFLIPLYTRILNPADYGVLDLFVMIGSIINLTIALEINQGLAFYHAKTENDKDKSTYASTAFWFTLAAYVAYLFLSFAFSVPLSQWVTGADQYQFIFELSSLYIFCNGIFLFLQNQLRWELRSTQFAISNITMTIITALCALVLAYYFHFGLVGILWGMILGVAAGVMTSGYNLLKTLHAVVDVPKLKEMLHYSVPLVPSGICVFLSIYIDRIMINKFMTLDDVGVYGIAVRFATISALLIAGFRGAMTPLILKHHQDESAPRDIVQIFNIYVAIALIMYLGASLFAHEILMVMTTSAYWAAAPVIPLLVLSTLVANLYIFTPGIFLVKKTYLVIWINFAIAAVNIFFNFLLLPLMGVMGAATATLIASLFGFAMYLYTNQKSYYLPFNYQKIAICITTIFAISLLGTDDISFINFVIKVIMVVVGIVVIHLCGLLNIKQVIGYFGRTR